MSCYDVIIIGAQPAGGRCARELAQKGHRVLLTEKAADFAANNFSTAGAPLEIMDIFSLPNSIVGTTWNKLRLSSSDKEHIKVLTHKGSYSKTKWILEAVMDQQEEESKKVNDLLKK